MLDTLLIGIGTAAARAVARLWMKDDAGLSLTEDFVNLLAEHIPGARAQRKAARQFDSMADHVADAVESLIRHESAALASNEKEAAVLAVRDILDGLQSIDARYLFDADLDPTSLETLLRQQPAARQRQDLSPPGRLLFDQLLSQTSRLIIDMATRLPAFGPQAIAEILRRETLIVDLLQEILDHMPAPERERLNQDDQFGERYKWRLAKSLDKLQLFGLNLGETTREQTLSIAYITLSASTDDIVAEERDALSVKQVTAVSDLNANSLGVGSIATDGSVRVDSALAMSNRHLIRGEAGSGKTTLLQWLAVNAAGSSLEGPLAGWSDKVPFFLQLRRYTESDLPRPEEFLAFTAGALVGDMPSGWVHRRLTEGRGLILIDGVDELPAAKRESARRWLTELVETYPDCTYVVTSRPPAVTARWLASLRFSTFELLPMSLNDIEGFIHHWHEAAAAQLVHIPSEVETLRRYEARLLSYIRDNRNIRSLATAPLLCAMLCALNRERRTQIPSDRMSLYRIALEMLLDRRDTEREIQLTDSLALTYRQKQLLLEELAYWLLFNEQSDMTVEQAVAVIDDRVASMPALQADAEKVFAHLLLRSGIIREPVAGRIDFIHRTFQEYLGAARAMSRGDVPALIRKGDRDTYREAVILAAGHGTERQTDELLHGLLDRGGRQQALRHKLQLLAVACLETAAQVSPDVLQAVHQALRTSLPPRNMTEARAVASAGELAAPLLKDFAAASKATEAAACVRALALIGSESSLHALASFAADRRITVIRELYRAWDYFDRTQYAELVLAGANLRSLRVQVKDLMSADALRHIPALGRVHMTLPWGVEIAQIPNPDLITDLYAWHVRSNVRLDGVAAFTRLQVLTVYNVEGSKLPPLPVTLEILKIFHAKELCDVSTLGAADSLTELSIAGARSVNLAAVSHGGIREFTIRDLPHQGDCAFVGNFSSLESLTLDASHREHKDTAFLGRDADCTYLQSLSRLERLAVSDIPTTKTLRGLPLALTHLSLSECHSLEDIDALAACSHLDSLILTDASKITNLEPLSDLSTLEWLELTDAAALTDLGPLGGLANLSRLDISGSGVADLSPLVACPSLHWLDLRDTPVTDFSPLLDISTNMLVDIDFDQKESLSPDLTSRHRFRVWAPASEDFPFSIIEVSPPDGGPAPGL